MLGNLIRDLWRAFALAVGDFFEAAAFRLVLAYDVLTGRMPRQVERRWWNRAVETPVLVDVYDWTDDRLIFSVLVWPSMESPADEAAHDHRQRVRTILEAISKGAADKAWSMRYEVDYGLRWNHERQAWRAQDGFAYDGSELRRAS